MARKILIDHVKTVRIILVGGENANYPPEMIKAESYKVAEPETFHFAGDYMPMDGPMKHISIQNVVTGQTPENFIGLQIQGGSVIQAPSISKAESILTLRLGNNLVRFLETYDVKDLVFSFES